MRTSLLFILISLLMVNAHADNKLLNILATSKDTPKIKALEKKLKKAPHNKAMTQALAQLYYRNDQYNKAIQLYEPLTEELNLNHLRNLVFSYGSVKKYSQQIKVYDLMKLRSPDNYNIIYSLAKVHLRYGKYPEAIAELIQVTKLKKRFVPAYTALIECHEKEKNYYESIGVANDMLILFGEKPYTVNKLCSLLTKVDIIVKAKKMCEKAIALQPHNEQNYLNLAINFKKNNQETRYLQLLKQANKKFPNNDSVLAMLGNYYLDNKRFKVAISTYKKSIKKESENLDAHRGIASAYVKVKKFDKALPSFKEVCKQEHMVSKDFKKATSQLWLSHNNKLAKKYELTMQKCSTRKRSFNSLFKGK